MLKLGWHRKGGTRYVGEYISFFFVGDSGSDCCSGRTANIRENRVCKIG